MQRICIKGRNKVSGIISASGAKNSSLPILFAGLLAEGESCISNVPHLADIYSAQRLLNKLGCTTEFTDNEFKILRPSKLQTEAPYDFVRKMRASILCLGPLVAKEGHAKVSLPGGCAIGARPVDQHLKALKKMGADIRLEEGYIFAKCKALRGEKIVFDFPTVGGTENTMMAATLASGETCIKNAAKEPEIVDLSEALKGMGAKIEGAGTNVIQIEGVSHLYPIKHQVIADRIEVGTLLITAALTQGQVKVTCCQPRYLDSFLDKLSETGVCINIGENWVEVDARQTPVLSPTNVETSPYPGFPTDLQAQFMTLMCIADGVSYVKETIFENRFMHIPELQRMGAKIQNTLKNASIQGNPQGLQSASVMATDLRASASLILAGLVAKGETKVKRIYHLDRGYEGLENKLESLGAKIWREEDI